MYLLIDENVNLIDDLALISVINNGEIKGFAYKNFKVILKTHIY